MAHVGIVTYNSRHLKTEQVVKNLFNDNFNGDQFTIFALPFVYHPARKELFSHRPNQFSGKEASEIAKIYKVPFVECSSDNDISSDCDIYIITGAGIISETCLRGKKMINCHPGIIPLIRGLDAFKWAIIDGKPVGNTLHFIDNSVDSGDIIAVKQTQLYKNDTLYSFSRRHYTEEIQMLSNYKYYLQHPQNDFVGVKQSEVHHRMPILIEQNLEREFENYKIKYASSQT